MLNGSPQTQYDGISVIGIIGINSFEPSRDYQKLNPNTQPLYCDKLSNVSLRHDLLLNIELNIQMGIIND